MARGTATERTARLEAQMEAVVAGIGRLEAQGAAASENRRRSYEAQERTSRDIITINHRLETVEKSVEAIRPTTVELERVRDRVLFAGKLGSILWSIGKALLSAAAGAAAAYYSLTGRPPP